MAQEIFFGQLDTDGEDGKRDGDAHDLEGDLVRVNTAGRDSIFTTPFGRIEEADSNGPNDDTECGGDGSFTEVKTLFDEEGKIRKDADEEAKPDVDDVDGRDLEGMEGFRHDGDGSSQRQALLLALANDG